MNYSRVVLVNSDDKKVGYSSLKEAHAGLGKKHRAFVTVLFDKQNQVLLQKRKHRLFDGFWDLTAISHNLRINGRDENYQEASDRAIKKEMGIGHVQINKVGAFNYFARDGQNCENEYCAVLTGNFSGSFIPNKDEVYEAKWVKFDEFISDIEKNPKKYTSWAIKAVKVIESLEPSQFMIELDNFFKVFSKYVKSFFSKKQELVKKYPVLMPKFYKELEEFSSGGKAMRPFLVYLGYRAGSPPSHKASVDKILPVCLAVELVHNFLLIHDDIIDQSETRRGKPTVHVKLAKGMNEHYGISQAIIIGDIACFEAIKLITEANIDNKQKVICIDRLLQTLLETGYGEALDVEYSYIGATLDKVWEVTNLKTARYSFVGPLTLGATLAGVKKSQMDHLAEFGLTLGTAFQIQDDILGVFGKEETLGKSVLSDMREGKNTILIYKAREIAGAKDRKTLDNLWGKSDATTSDLEKVKRIISDSGSLDWAKAQNQKLAKKAKGYINKITNSHKLKIIFGQMVDFVVKRES